MVEFKGLMIAGLLLALFIFAAISFGVQISEDTGANMSLLDNEVINRSYREVELNITFAQTTAESQKTSFFRDVPIIGEIVGAFDIILGSIIGVGRIFGNVLVSLYNLTFGLIASVLGVSPVVISVFTTILLILIVLLAWRVYRSGS